MVYLLLQAVYQNVFKNTSVDSNQTALKTLKKKFCLFNAQKYMI